MAEMNLATGHVAAARDLFRRCLDTGVISDPENISEPMSEYELAAWRLAQLPSPTAN